MATNIGKAYVQIIPSADGIEENLTNVLDGASKKAGKQAGGSFSNAFANVPKVGAAAVGATTAAIGACTAALYDGAKATAAYGDKIDKASQQLGISAEAYQEWDAVLQHSGTSMDAMGASFKTLANAAQGASKDQVAAFEAIGLSMDEVASLSTEELWSRTIEGLQGMEEGTERTAIATDLLGRGAQSLGALFNTSSEDTQKMIDTVNELGGVMSGDAIKASAEFQDNLQDLNTAFEGLKRGALSQLLPAINPVISGLTDIFAGKEGGIGKIAGGIAMLSNTMLEALPTVMDTVTEIIGAISQSILNNLPLILDTGFELVGKLAEGIIESLPTILDAGFEIISKIASSLIENLPEIFNAGYKILIELIKGITDTLPELIRSVIDIVPEVSSAFVDNLPLIMDAGIELLFALIDGIMGALPDLIDALPEVITTTVDTLLSMTDTLIECGIELLTALVGDLPTIINGIVDVVPDIISGLITAIIDNLPDIILAGVDLFTALVGDLPTIVFNIVGAIPEIIAGIIGAIKDAWPDIKQAGIDLMDNLGKGLLDGLTAAGEGILTAVEDMGNSIISGFKDVFDIASPSKKMNWMGQMVDEGLAGGLTQNTSTVTDAMRDMAKTTLNTAQVEFSGNMAISGQSFVSNSNDELYQLLATYLPNIAEKENSVNVTLEGDAEGLFRTVQKQSKIYTRSTGLVAFS